MFFLISVVSNKVLHICFQEPPLISKIFMVLLHTLSRYNSLLVRYKVYSSDPGNVCVQAEGMLKPMKTLVLIQHYVERILWKNKIIILNCHPLLLGENYIEIKAWQLKFASSDPFFHEKLHWNKSVTAKSLETEHLRQPFDNKSWY